MYRIRLVFLFITSFILLKSQNNSEICHHADPRGATREKNILPLDLRLDIKLLEKQGKIEGKAAYKFLYLRKEIDTLFFDGIQMDIQSVKINNSPIRFKTDSAGITMYLPTTRNLIKSSDTQLLEIEYSCYPERGIYFLNWNNNDPKSYKQIWTQGQGIDNRHWIPGYDDVSNLQTVTSNITFNDKYPLVSNGHMKKVIQNDDMTKTWTYQINAPHALYLIMIATGDYKFKTLTSQGGVKIEQYYYPDKEHCFEPTYKHSEVMMDWFETEIGVPYAWDKIYRNIPTRDFLFGAMENTTSTIFADYMHQDSRAQLERAYLGVNAHELAHQWFGDLVTERSPPHHWLHESFATHYAKKFIQSLKGEEEFDANRKGELNASFAAGQSNSLPVAHTYGGSPRHYPKGSFVLDMLRNELGNENYRKSIQYYLTKHYHQNVETSDLQAAIYEATGRNVDWFFDQWIQRGGEPILDVDFLVKAQALDLFINQTHKKEATVTAFRLPMTATVHYKSGKMENFPLDIRNEKEVITINLNSKEVFDYVLVDENMNFLRKINYTKGELYNKHILKNCSSYMARLEAVERLLDVKWNDKKALYLDVFHHEKSSLVKKQILSQISMIKEDEIAQDILSHGLQDADHLVRRNAINAMNVDNAVLKQLLIARLKDSSYINIETAFEKLWKLYPDEKRVWLSEIKGIDGINNNLKLLYATKTIKLTEVLDQAALLNLLELSSESSEYRARIPAMAILMENKIYHPVFLKNLIQASFYFHPGIRNAAIQHLRFIKDREPALLKKAIELYPFQEPKKTREILAKRLN